MGFVKDTVESLTGKSGAEAAQQSAAIQQRATERGISEIEAARELGLGFLEPFGEVGRAAIPQAGFLTDPQAQFEFLQQNPLFQSALEQANVGTKGIAAARGRLSAGDTLQQLSQNVLLAASPLISQQKQSIQDLLGFGGDIATRQAATATGAAPSIAELITSGGAAEAAGVVGAEQARGKGIENIIGIGGTGGIFSDERLKENIKKINVENGHNIYSWKWNDLAKRLFGLVGSSFGVLAQEVQKTNPEAISEDTGFLKVNYSLIGVNHGR
jgi:hypothetical protein